MPIIGWAGRSARGFTWMRVPFKSKARNPLGLRVNGTAAWALLAVRCFCDEAIVPCREKVLLYFWMCLFNFVEQDDRVWGISQRRRELAVRI
jgi:hypothetical protein